MARPLRRQNVGSVIRKELKSHRGVTVVFTPPNNTQAIAWFEGGANNYMECVIHGVTGLEGHPEAAEFGEMGSPQRAQFVELMDPRVIFEIGAHVYASILISEDEAKN